MNPGDIRLPSNPADASRRGTGSILLLAQEEITKGSSAFPMDQSPDVRCERIQTGTRHKIKLAMDYMLAHLAEPLEMSSVSKWIGVSTSTFYYLFKRATGYSPNDFMIRARMLLACQWLRHSDLSVKEVAMLLGYHDQFYFSRLFKSVTGIPPREYRTRAQSARIKPTPTPALAGNKSGLDFNEIFKGLPNALNLEKNPFNSEDHPFQQKGNLLE